ncbi:MAG: bifunctional glutamate N-acetyltransferase/amino-acid acetyltransferase ArgJ [Methylocystaceae bacterium]
MYKEISGGITAVPGFKAQGVYAQIKYKNIRDVAVIFAEEPCPTAAVFTTNVVKAAPLKVTRKHLVNGRAQAIVINSGNANACTGSQGDADAERMAETAAASLGIDPELVLVASTGVIGVSLPIDRVEAGIKDACTSLEVNGAHNAALAIMTTDTQAKEIALEFEVGGRTVHLGAMAKGSGMIHPNMATMLGFITTDVNIAQAVLYQALKAAVEDSFNMISVDGDTSTNDMVIAMANGYALNPIIDVIGSRPYNQFVAALGYVCQYLALMIAADGEGATKLIEVQVENAPSKGDARKAARAVVSSDLTKSAVYGEDPNWGRIICAVGYSGAEFDPNQVDIYLGEVQVAADGMGLTFNEEQAIAELKKEKVIIRINMKQGEEGAVAWGCDLTEDYIRINASYRT